MDLLANYESEEEEDEPAVPSSSGNNSVFSIPPPRGSAVAVSVDDEALKKKSGSAGGCKANPWALSSDFFDETSIVSHDVTSPKGIEKASSLFSKLPPPSTRLSLASLPPPSSSKLKKKTVEFNPPVNFSVLESTVEDEEESRKKRTKVSEVHKTESGAKVGGLAALLPPPKNSLGSGLAFGGGGGSAGGRRAVMETTSTSTNITKDVILPKPGTGSKEGDNAVWQPTVSSSEKNMRVNINTQYHYSAQPGQGPIVSEPSNSELEVRIPEGNYAQEQYTADDGYQNGGYRGFHAGGGYQNEIQQGDTDWQYSDAHGGGAEPSSANPVTDPLAEVFQRERRKGKSEVPPQFIEVKQADLTAGRGREDQLRTTGIAFGPNYQPVSAGKDKPSKIHRRKHQIGALYFDMKSKEMELLDRRSRGTLTKAETQAKYGW